MKKLSDFLIRLKPYRRLNKIFWMSFTLICLFVFQMLMLIFSSVVIHKNSGFYYWFRGFHSLLVDSWQEPNSARGFIFASTIIGTIPSVAMIPFLYFIFMNWLILEKLSDKFISVPKDKYKFWSTYIHFTSLGGVFFILFGCMSYLGNGSILPHKAFYALPNAFSDVFILRIGGISAFLYYGVGCVFLLIMIFWNIGIIIKYIFVKISAWLEKMKELRMIKKEEKLSLKSQKIESKNNKTK
ncbi:hypothetical protein SCORR_v1c02850 [Spiroplasma corruscae]|uniref:Uncharacterized protein n=1 Tax=Spiroplasma corruscae TaxID=216934 RepID=A0A222ENI1_9MOLU|nr:hypothetical protein [Spiroplasma corruscae]ASP28059.1 hypothetical protein SCORR_v1c02850 [Spiroplasma corruscae]